MHSPNRRFRRHGYCLQALFTPSLVLVAHYRVGACVETSHVLLHHAVVLACRSAARATHWLHRLLLRHRVRTELGHGAREGRRDLNLLGRGAVRGERVLEVGAVLGLLVLVLQVLLGAVRQLVIWVHPGVVLVSGELVEEVRLAHLLLLLLEELVALARLAELRRVQLLERLLLLEVLVEAGELSPQREDVLHLLKQDGVELVDVLLDVALRLLHVLQQTHVLLDDVHDVVDVLSVAGDQAFFLL